MADNQRRRLHPVVEGAWNVLKAGSDFIGARYAVKRMHEPIGGAVIEADAYKRRRFMARKRLLHPKGMAFRRRIIRRRPIRRFGRRRMVRRRRPMFRKRRMTRPIQKGLAAYNHIEMKYGYSNADVTTAVPVWSTNNVSTCSEIAAAAATAGQECIIYFTDFITVGYGQSNRLGRAITWVNLNMRFTIISSSAEAYCRWALMKTIQNPAVADRGLEYANPNGFLTFTSNLDPSWNHPYKPKWMDAQMAEGEVWKRYKLIKTGTIFMPEWDKSRRVNFRLKWRPDHRPTAWYDGTANTIADKAKGQYFLCLWADSSEVFQIIDLYRQWSYTDA